MTIKTRPSVTALTLNLRFGLADDGPNAWIHRRFVLRDFLKSHNRDFMLFQEANDFQIAFLSTCLPGYAFIGKRTPAPDFWQNNVIFYRAPWQLDTWEHFYLSPTPEIPSRSPDSHWPRQCTLGRFRAGHQELVCGTTHLDFEPPVQVASAELIRGRIDRMAAGHPVILAGDFNCSPTSACHAVFTRRAGKPGPHGAPFRNIFKPPFPGTFHGFTGSDDGRCIDWILFRGAITPLNAGVVTFPEAACYPSDHFPIVADFSLEIGEGTT